MHCCGQPRMHFPQPIYVIFLLHISCQPLSCHFYNDSGKNRASCRFQPILPYSSSITGSNHFEDVFSTGVSTAKWENQESAAAPCQCFTLAGILITVPGIIGTSSFLLWSAHDIPLHRKPCSCLPAALPSFPAFPDPQNKYVADDFQEMPEQT